MGDALRESTSNSLRVFLASNNIHFPIDSFDLLRLLLAFIATSDASSPHLRLTDIGHFESYLEHWARHWDYGTLVVVRDNDPIYGYGKGGLSVVAAQLHPEGHYSRKRKRGEEDIKTGERPPLSRSIASVAICKATSDASLPRYSYGNRTPATFGCNHGGYVKSRSDCFQPALRVHREVTIAR
jgi:hypothetical protein